MKWKCEEVLRVGGGLYRGSGWYRKMWIMHWEEENLMVIMKGSGSELNFEFEFDWEKEKLMNLNWKWIGKRES